MTCAVSLCFFFFFQAEDGIRDTSVTGVQTCALPISPVVDMPRTLPGSHALRSDHKDLRDGQHHPARVRPRRAAPGRRRSHPGRVTTCPALLASIDGSGEHTCKEAAMVDGDGAQPAPPAIL